MSESLKIRSKHIKLRNTLERGVHNKIRIFLGFEKKIGSEHNIKKNIREAMGNEIFYGDGLSDK